MSRASSRQQLRDQRQERNKGQLTPDKKKKHPKAAEQFIIFGGRHGHKTTPRSFESFVAQHG